jgi:hypothetical protein
MRFKGVGLASVGIVLIAATIASAETCTLELKKLEPRDRSRPITDPMDNIYRATQSQGFYRQMQPDGKGGFRYFGDDRQDVSFKNLVKKEPKYVSDHPFRGVARLGSQEFAFVLDTSKPPPAEKDEKAEDKQTKKESKPTNSATAKLADRMLKTMPSADKMPPRVAFDRLYFDFNHNGDLTDDKPVEGKATWNSYQINSGVAGSEPVPQQMWYAQAEFPRLDVSVLVDGKPVDTSFSLSGHVQFMPSHSYMSYSISAGAYREGHITLDGKKRHVVLIDFNSNGLFNDESKVRSNVRGRNQEVYPEQGDMLLVDPTPPRGGIYESPYDTTSSGYRHNVSKLVNIDGQFYDLAIAPAGDQLTLTRSTVAVGNLKNPNDGFRATIYSDKGFLQISGDKNTPVPVPEGEWKLLAYTITVPESPKPAEPTERKDQKKEVKKDGAKKTTLVDVLAKKAETILGAGQSIRIGRVGPKYTRVSARGTSDYKPVKVVKGQTVELPFGPPYRPVVKAWNYYGNNQKPRELQLELAIIGSAGEICSDMMVDGSRPGKPEFTITDDKQKIVQQGSFEYG